ncbi:MAG: hypothetical protein HUU49_01275 [Candidatus Buchananbacteria bacterium]|nr:hypothetical protein [Candidatus Buchananbacteria bacterium]
MKELINIARKHIVLTLLSAAAIVAVTGQLGIGEFLNNRSAYGYGGGLGYLIRPIISINRPLLIPEAGREGQLFKHFTDATVKVEVPPRAVAGYALFDVDQLIIGAGDNVCSGSGEIIGNKAFTVKATNQNGSSINTFEDNLIVSITMPGLPVNSSNLGVYYFNTNHQWVYGAPAVFNVENSEVTFQIRDLGTFAIINASGLPRLIESETRCQGVVLGVKDFEEGAILRTCDAQMYEIQNNQAVSIGRLDLINRTYESKPVNDVDYDVIVRYTKPGTEPVSRQKNFSDGELLRTCDWKIYRIEGDGFRHIKTYTELQKYWEGQTINNVDYWQIAKYRNLDYSPDSLTPGQQSQVLGAKTYAKGTFVRTPDSKVYVVEDSTVRFVVELPKSTNLYTGARVIDIEFDDLVELRTELAGSEARVLGVKSYGDGALLRTRDWNVYRVEGTKIRKVGVVVGPNADTLNGQKVIDVDYATLAYYTKVEDTTVAAPAVTGGQVLGVKQYADGTLLRVPDGRVFVVRNGKPQHIATLDELNKNYPGVKIISITTAELDNLINGASQVTTGGRVLGVKKYGDGSLLKTPDWKLYEVKDGRVHHIATIPGSQDFYQGKKINQVTYEELAQYEQAQ